MLKPENINSLTDAQIFIEGVLNDLEDGIITKDEALELMGEYTIRIIKLVE